MSFVLHILIGLIISLVMLKGFQKFYPEDYDGFTDIHEIPILKSFIILILTFLWPVALPLLVCFVAIHFITKLLKL